MSTVISVEHLSKTYRLGQIGTGTFTNDLKVWWAKMRGKPNPLLRIGETDPLLTAKSAKAAKEELNLGALSGLRGSKNREDDNTIWALKDISFTVEQGEVLGIIGRNGAGKSTLLKILSRVTAPTSGKIKVKGRVASLLEVGTGFHPELTGRENIYLNGAILGMNRREIDRKFDEIVDFAEVEKFIDTPVKRYSSGMYVRLAFAVAAHLEPEILVVDEVLAVGDADFQKKCLGKMGDVAKKGRTVLFVSHNMGAVQNLCRRGIWLNNGHLAEDGLVIDAVSSYLNSKTIQQGLDISSRTDRKGIGKVHFEKVEFLNKFGQQINSIMSGTELCIRVYYNAPCDQHFQNARFSIAVEKNGISYFVASTEMTEKNNIKILGSGWIDCQIPKLPLASGNYGLTLFCEAGGAIQDWLENAVILPVDGGDFFGTGRIAPASHEGKYVLVEHKWDNYAKYGTSDA
ncbi:MAG: ABC transporter ATP-binding protein [Chloroflexi bacterium]|nr:ABC transporter ATP-binding protein [Chloroflexota bacterium]